MMWTPAVRFLIITNVVIFLLAGLAGIEGFLATFFGLVPQLVLTRGWIWQLVTYMFLHYGFMHILFNMFALWMFGSTLERVWGTRAFLKYYFLTGIGGGLCYFIFNLHSSIPTVGASGAIYGLLIGYAVLFPESLIYIWFVIPIKAKWFAVIFGAMEFFFSLRPGDSIAHLAHLGGMAVGYLYLKRERLFGKFIWQMRMRKQEYEARVRRKKEEDLSSVRQEVDELLDKINRVGYDGLTRTEQRKLKRASAILRKKGG
jgi:membrane associated rhomboid family serine protease